VITRELREEVREILVWIVGLGTSRPFHSSIASASLRSKLTEGRGRRTPRRRVRIAGSVEGLDRAEELGRCPLMSPCARGGFSGARAETRLLERPSASSAARANEARPRRSPGEAARSPARKVSRTLREAPARPWHRARGRGR
jgi:hypothetical protein